MRYRCGHLSEREEGHRVDKPPSLLLHHEAAKLLQAYRLRAGAGSSELAPWRRPLPRRLTELDEWPRHPTIDTFDRVATDSPHWSDGYWFCIGDPEGAVNLITAIRF